MTNPGIHQVGSRASASSSSRAAPTNLATYHGMMRLGERLRVSPRLWVLRGGCPNFGRSGQFSVGRRMCLQVGCWQGLWGIAVVDSSERVKKIINGPIRSVTILARYLVTGSAYFCRRDSDRFLERRYAPLFFHLGRNVCCEYVLTYTRSLSNGSTMVALDEC